MTESNCTSPVPDLTEESNAECQRFILDEAPEYVKETGSLPPEDPTIPDDQELTDEQIALRNQHEGLSFVKTMFTGPDKEEKVITLFASLLTVQAWRRDQLELISASKRLEEIVHGQTKGSADSEDLQKLKASLKLMKGAEQRLAAFLTGGTVEDLDLPLRQPEEESWNQGHFGQTAMSLLKRREGFGLKNLFDWASRSENYRALHQDRVQSALKHSTAIFALSTGHHFASLPIDDRAAMLALGLEQARQDTRTG